MTPGRWRTRWRQVNHLARDGSEFPIQYSTLQMGSKGHIVAMGRDLRAMASMQQQLVEAQQSLARDYARLRQMESRYRLLFQIASEAVIVLDPDTGKVLEANPASSELLDRPPKRLVGKRFSDCVAKSSVKSLAEMLAQVRASGQPHEIDLQLEDQTTTVHVAASLFRGEGALQVLVRLSRPSEDGTGLPKGKTSLLTLVDQLPDGFVVADAAGAIVSANNAFLEMVQLATEDQAKGENLERFIGRSGVEYNVLMANLKEHRAVRHFATSLRGAYGSTENVDISSVAVGGDPPMFGFTLRPLGARLPVAANEHTPPLPRSLESMTELIGRVPMKELVREATDMIERLCIEAALDLTDDNRASAADVLGLSRQSLYAKLRRHGLGDLGPE